DPPAVYVAAPSVESESQEAPQQEVTTDPADADPVNKIESSLKTVAAAVEELRGQVEALKAPIQTQKAQEVTEPAKLEVADNLDEKIALAVSKAFESFGLKNLVEEVQVMKSALEVVSNEPVDQSISVSKAKDTEDDDDPMTRFKKLKSEGQDPLSAALAAGYLKKK